MASQTVTDGSGKTLSPAWSMAHIVQGPSFPPPERLRCYLLALPGAGKTTYAASIEGALHLDGEDSACFVSNPRNHRIAITNGKQLEDVIHLLEEQAGRKDNPFKHVVFDTIESMLLPSITYLTEQHNSRTTKKIADIREFGKDGAGWGRVNEYVTGLCRRVYAAGYGWTVCGHLKEEQRHDNASGNKITVLRPLINDGIKGSLVRDSQYMMRLRKDVRKEPTVRKTAGGQTIMDSESVTKFMMDLTSPQTGDTITQMVKDRLGEYLPPAIDVTGDDGYRAFANAYMEACEKAMSSRT